MLEQKPKNVVITLTQEQIDKARLIAIEVVGKKSISGFLAYYITNYKLSPVNNQDV